MLLFHYYSDNSRLKSVLSYQLSSQTDQYKERLTALLRGLCFSSAKKAAAKTTIMNSNNDIGGRYIIGNSHPTKFKYHC